MSNDGEAESPPLRVRLGEPFELRFREVGTAGYVWSLRGDVAEAVEVVESRHERAAAGGIGAAGTRVMRLRPLRPGSQRLRFALARPWEQAPREEREVRIDVVE